VQAVAITQPQVAAAAHALSSSASASHRPAPLPLQAALTKASRMKDRFHDLFSMDEARNPRSWTPQEDVPRAARRARAAAANVLAQLAVIRRPGKLTSRGPDAVEAAVMRLVQQVGASLAWFGLLVIVRTTGACRPSRQHALAALCVLPAASCQISMLQRVDCHPSSPLQHSTLLLPAQQSGLVCLLDRALVTPAACGERYLSPGC
jgi:hypothetical protein